MTGPATGSAAGHRSSSTAPRAGRKLAMNTRSVYRCQRRRRNADRRSWRGLGLVQGRDGTGGQCCCGSETCSRSSCQVQARRHSLFSWGMWREHRVCGAFAVSGSDRQRHRWLREPADRAHPGTGNDRRAREVDQLLAFAQHGRVHLCGLIEWRDRHPSARGLPGALDHSSQNESTALDVIRDLRDTDLSREQCSHQEGESPMSASRQPR